MDIVKVFRRWRENYYVSTVSSNAARPIERSCLAVAHRLRSHVPRNGVAFTIPNGEVLHIGRDAGINIATNLFWGGLDSFEPATSRALRFFFSRAQTFVDIGANHGFYSLLAARWNPHIRIAAFEPVPQIFHGLQENIKLNNVQNQVHAHCVALSDVSGPATLYVPTSGSRESESTATLAQGSWQQRKNSPAIDVQAERFEDFERENPLKLDLVKIDVEDHEAAVLRGMQSVICRDRPFVVCEILPRAHRNEKTREIVASLGYTPYWITPSGYIRVSRFDFDRYESQDFLLSPVKGDGEVLTDLEPLWAMRQAEVTA